MLKTGVSRMCALQWVKENLAAIGGDAARVTGGLPLWPQYTLGRRETMVLNTVSLVELRPLEKELKLWEGVL